MSNNLNLEPRAYGIIKFETTFGQIDIELFTKQCPKACRNFVQLCLSGCYENATIDRIEKDFIAVVGNIDGKDAIRETFNDEFHSRLRFVRRGLVATANKKKNDNGPEFFFTLGPAPELQNKHSIFGRVIGQSVYSLVDLNECQVDDENRPFTEQRINRVTVVDNPYPDLKQKRPLTLEKDPKLHESSSDEETVLKPNLDIVNSKRLSFFPEDQDDEDDEDPPHVDAHPTLGSNPRDTNSSQGTSPKASEKQEVFNCPDDLKNEVADQVDEKISDKERRLMEIRAQILSIKQKIETESETKTLAERRKASIKASSEEISLKEESIDGGASDNYSKIAPKRSKDRERETIEMVARFKKRLKQAASNPTKSSHGQPTLPTNYEADDLALLEKLDSDEWLSHKFEANDDESWAKDDDAYTTNDPRTRRLEHRDEQKPDIDKESIDCKHRSRHSHKRHR